MAEPKTRPDDAASVHEFIRGIADESRREDCFALTALMSEVSGAPPRMWGSSIIGFGERHYRYASGRAGDALMIGFSPRKDALALYTAGYLEQFADLLPRLGKHKTGKGCLYIKRLQAINLGVLRELLARSVSIGSQPAQP